MRLAIMLMALGSTGLCAQDDGFLAQREAARAAQQTTRGEEFREQAERMAERAREQAARGADLARQHALMATEMARVGDGDSAYRSGTRAIDRRDYEGAIATFDKIIAAKSTRSDGAFYWKAYAQNRLGRREQSLATLAQLQKEFPQSRWSGDAKALDVEVRQAAGRPVSPDAESDEELKLLAINGLMNNDPSRAMPLLEKVIADPKLPPRVKENALFVVAQSGDPKARDLLLQIAKGRGNPDIQMKAVEYLGVFGKGNTQPLADVYAATTDAGVKRAVLRGLMMAGDSDRLLSLAKSEKSPELRVEAIHMLGAMRKDSGGDSLVSLYGPEADRSVKNAVIDGLFMQQNAKALIEFARKERDAAVKKEIVQRLSMMRSKEASDFLMELINK